MVRYYRQVKDYNCGPVAILNATKWGCDGLGYPSPSRLLLPKLMNICRCDETGTSRFDLDWVLRKVGGNEFWGWNVRRVMWPNRGDLKKHLLAGPDHAFVLNYMRGHERDDIRHIVFCPQFDGKYFHVINIWQHVKVRIGPKGIRSLLYKRHSQGKRKYPVAWLLKKCQK